MGKFLKKIILFAPIILVIAVFNVIVDPANVYIKEYVTEIAELMLSGENVAGINNCDERTLQEEIIERESICPDTIILGSSRIMTMSGEVIKDKGRCRNHGMSGAGIFDYLGVLGIYNSNNKLPNTVILGLDPWILNENNGETRYQSIMPYIKNFEKTLHVYEKSKDEKECFSFDKRFQTLLSVAYFQNSVKFLLQNPEKLLRIGQDIDFYATRKTVVDENLRYADGSIEYQLEERKRDVGQVNVIARKYVAREIYQVEEYDFLYERYCVLLKKLIEYLQEKEVEVLIFLPPYHPYVYQYFEKNTNYKNIMEAEKFIRNLGNEKGIGIYGSYDPKKAGCYEEDFVDGMHLKRSSIGKIWKNTD